MSGEVPDIRSRYLALTDHKSTLLIEAGAGTGKTALIAGRVACLMASGVSPRSIAAITFTEQAASELQQRVSYFVDRLLCGQIDPEIEVAFKGGIDEIAQANLNFAKDRFDEFVCSTIHGFCQSLIRPYPVESGFDPGAQIMDQAEAELTFKEVFETWLHERFDGTEEEGDLFAEIVQEKQEKAVELIRDMAWFLRSNRTTRTEPAFIDLSDIEPLRDAVHGFRTWYSEHNLEEAKTEQILCEFEEALIIVDNLLADGVTPSTLVRLGMPPRIPTAQKKDKWDFKQYQTKTKWQNAAKTVGLAKSAGDEYFNTAQDFLRTCQEAYLSFFRQVSAALIHDFCQEFDELLSRYEDYKRTTARLDFDDLLLKARDLLQNNDGVRHALSNRYKYILVDEFQDTDPIQCQVLWWLAGESIDYEDETEWHRRRINPGQLFLVGDPKQSIYRFRGADVVAYLTARNAIAEQFPDNIIPVSTNFRSRPEILDWVNDRFQEVIEQQDLSFDPLVSNIERDGALRVWALDIEVKSEQEQPKAEVARESEAQAVAQICQRLIDSYEVMNKIDGIRVCKPGDIALLAPTGTDLWIYERYLEESNIPIATQAGKGFFSRQEIQDLIALSRVLADARDTLALGALLRGPLVGLSEQQLLDVISNLPREQEGRIPRLTLWTDPHTVKDLLTKKTLMTLQALAQRARSTTPYELLAEGVERFHVRALLSLRHKGHSERALANVDRFLEFAQPYAVRGLRAFARDMRTRWEESERQIEGRPDAEMEAVQLITVHSAKGLEWPVVIPINTMTKCNTGTASILVRRQDNTLHSKELSGFSTLAYDELAEQDNLEREAERQRVWYVAATRASQLLILPRLDRLPKNKLWQHVINLDLVSLHPLDVTHLPDEMTPKTASGKNTQNRENFVAQAEHITRAKQVIQWHQPSRHETIDYIATTPSESYVISSDEDLGLLPLIRGGPIRGQVMHKLIEEILTGEVAEQEDILIERAQELLIQLGAEISADPVVGFSPSEIAGLAVKGINHTALASIRHRLIPEATVFMSFKEDGEEIVTAGIADALAVQEDFTIDAVVDWKSDVEITMNQRNQYADQVRSYVRSVGAKQGFVVYCTTGIIDHVK